MVVERFATCKVREQQADQGVPHQAEDGASTYLTTHVLSLLTNHIDEPLNQVVVAVCAIVVALAAVSRQKGYCGGTMTTKYDTLDNNKGS